MKRKLSPATSSAAAKSGDEDTAEDFYGDTKANAEELTPFKQKFKYYKSKSPMPNFEDVIDFSNPKNFEDSFETEKLISHENSAETDFEKLGLKPVSQWICYNLRKFHGLRIIREVFTIPGQCAWAEKCLKVYCEPPHVTNIEQFIDTKPRDAYKILDHPRSVQKLRWSTQGIY